MTDTPVETALRQVAYSGPGSATWLAYSRSSPSGVNAGWLAEKSLSLLAELRSKLEAAEKVMEQYSGWWDGSPEDSWRLERDMRAALGMKPYEEDNDG